MSSVNLAKQTDRWIKDFMYCHGVPTQIGSKVFVFPSILIYLTTDYEAIVLNSNGTKENFSSYNSYIKGRKVRYCFRWETKIVKDVLPMITFERRDYMSTRKLKNTEIVERLWLEKSRYDFFNPQNYPYSQYVQTPEGIGSYFWVPFC